MGANWKDKAEGKEIVANKTFKITGTFSTGGGFHCPKVEMELELHPGNAGDVNTFSIENTAECSVTGAFAALGCNTVTAHAPVGLWKITDEGTNIKFTNFALNVTLKGTGTCSGSVAFQVKNKAGASITATPNNAESISSVVFGGEGEMGGLSVAIGGAMNVLEPNIGTFGL